MKATRKAEVLGGIVAACVALGGCASQYGAGTTVLGASGLVAGKAITGGPIFTVVSTILGASAGAAVDAATCSYLSAASAGQPSCRGADTATSMDSAPAAEENPFDVAMAEVEPPEPAPADEADEGDEVDEEMAGLADELGGGGEEENEGVRVEQVDEGVWITFDSRVLFGFDSHALRSDVHATLRRIATTLARHPDKEILVIGHTDATGPEQYNKKLSLKRAHAVAAFLLQEGVNRERITEVGRGEDKPVAGNDTREGRRANRRVEIAIYADRELKRAALEGMIDGTLRPELE